MLARKPKSKGEVVTVVRTLSEVIGHLEVRANDPWPDECWPAAKTVLDSIAEEIRAMQREIRTEYL